MPDKRRKKTNAPKTTVQNTRNNALDCTNENKLLVIEHETASLWSTLFEFDASHDTIEVITSYINNFDATIYSMKTRLLRSWTLEPMKQNRSY